MANSCQVKMHDDNLCEEEIFNTSEQKCIFHSSNDELKKKFFRGKIESRINLVESREEKNIHDFQDFVFPHYSFSGNIFTKPVNFKGAKFKDSTAFLVVKFEKDTVFSTAKFDEVNFVGTSFLKVDFSAVTFNGNVLFLGDMNNKCFYDECIFHRLIIGANVLITFEKVILSKATFLDTNLERIIFRDVEWYRTKFLRRKQALWDEFTPLEWWKRGERDYEKIAENYRQLVINYERKRDYETAENFHIGEMETRRKKKGAGAKGKLVKGIKEWVNSYTIYKLFSNYGTGYWQAFIVFLTALALFSCVLLYSGFELAETSTDKENVIINYNVCAHSEYQKVSFKQWVSDLGKAVLLTSSMVAFQRERLYKPVGDISYGWLIVSRILLTAQAALFLLAIRRRFKR